MFQCPGVVLSKILDVQHRHIERLEQFKRFAKRGRIAAGENALADPRVQRLRIISTDKVQKTAARFVDRAAHHTHEFVVVVLAHVLEHAYRNESIIASGNVSIVVLDEFDLPGEAHLVSLLAREGDLFLRDVEGAYPDAIFASHMQPQRSPAAASLDHLLTGANCSLRQTWSIFATCASSRVMEGRT